MRPNRRLTVTRPQQGRNRNSGQRRNRDPKIYKCALCQKHHPLRICKRFLNMTIGNRLEIVKRHRYCLNCLARSHSLRSCSSMETCKKCDHLHHTLLHPSSQTQSQGDQQPPRLQRKPSLAATENKLIVDAIISLARVLGAADNKSQVA